jgi:plastocyanin
MTMRRRRREGPCWRTATRGRIASGTIGIRIGLIRVGAQCPPAPGRSWRLPGGAQNLAVMRFKAATKVIHAGQTVEWTNTDPVTRDTITFGTEPADFMPPSANVTVDDDGARSATINSPSDSVNSGLIVASLHERTGIAQAPLGVTRFRVKFTNPGVYPYICAIHDNLAMKGEVIVLP